MCSSDLAFKEIEKNRVKSLVKGILKDISEEMPEVVEDRKSVV